EHARRFRLGPALIATSRIVDPAHADDLIARGVVDAVGVTGALIAASELPQKARSGHADEILRCIGCNACIAHYHAGTEIACAVNPRTGRERRLPQAGRAGGGPRPFVVGG